MRKTQAAPVPAGWGPYLSERQWGTVGMKDNRYYFAYTFDQYLYQSKENPKE